MKCDSCGKTIEDANALTCPFCNAELKSPEEIEVLDDEPKEESVPEETTEKVEESTEKVEDTTEEVEEAKEEKVEEEVEVKEEPKVEETIEPSIISSEEISIDSIGVEKPKKKKNKKKKDKDASEEEENKDEPKEEVKEEQTEEKPQEEEKVEETPQNEEKVQEEQTEEKPAEEEKTDEVYEPFVEAENVVPLPPKKTLGYRIKDFYRSMFEGYEKLPEIKVDDRETRLTLDKIYEKTSKEAEEKKISGNDVAIVWLACFVFAFIAFFVLTAISFIIDIIVGDKNNTSILTVIIPVFQIGVPIFFLAFGWLIGIVYSYIKRNKKRNR